jgi:acylphosphatase
MIRRRVVVHGQVQGVFFRDSTRRLAQQHGVAGSVSNRWDAVRRLVDFARKGPRGAQVESIEVTEEAPEGLTGFTVR